MRSPDPHHTAILMIGIRRWFFFNRAALYAVHERGRQGALVALGAYCGDGCGDFRDERTDGLVVRCPTAVSGSSDVLGPPGEILGWHRFGKPRETAAAT